MRSGQFALFAETASERDSESIRAENARSCMEGSGEVTSICDELRAYRLRATACLGKFDTWRMSLEEWVALPVAGLVLRQFAELRGEIDALRGQLEDLTMNMRSLEGR